MARLIFNLRRDFTREKLEAILQKPLVVLKIGPVDPKREYIGYRELKLPEQPENLQLPLIADAYETGCECSNHDVYYALFLQRDLSQPSSQARLEELKERYDLPIREEIPATVKLYSKERGVSLEIVMGKENKYAQKKPRNPETD